MGKKRGSIALARSGNSSSSSSSSLQMPRDTLGSSFGISSSEAVPCQRFVTPAVLAERARILRLPQREREREVHEWHSGRERDQCRQQVPLHKVWEMVFAYGINVLQHDARAPEPAEAKQSQPKKLRKTGAFRSHCEGATRVGYSQEADAETEREDTEDMEDSEDPDEAMEGFRAPMKGVSPGDASAAPTLARAPAAACSSLSKGCQAVLHAVISRVNTPYPYSYGGADQTPILYDWLKETVRGNLLARVLPPLTTRRDMPLVHAFIAAWGEHQAFTKDLWAIFNTLDRNCCVERKLPSITSACLQAFHEHIFSVVKHELRASILHIVRQIRDDVNSPSSDASVPYFLPSSKINPVAFEHLRDECIAQQCTYEGAAPANSAGLRMHFREQATWGRTSWLLDRGIFMYAVMGVVATRNDLRGLHDVPSSFATMPAEGLGLYALEFEVAFLQVTQDYYAVRSAEWLRAGDATGYMRQVVRACQNESIFADAHLHSATADRLLAICVGETVVRHRDVLLARVSESLRDIFAASTSAFVASREQVEMLQCAYDLFRYTAYCMGGSLAQVLLQMLPTPEPNLTKAMADAFRERIKRSGHELLERRRAEVARMTAEYEQWQGGSRQSAPPRQPSANDSELVEGLLRLLCNSQRICVEIFKSDKLFEHALREGLEESVNDRMLERPSPVEILAAHCNKLLRKGKAGPARPDVDLQRELTHCLQLFALSREKDVFEESYRVLLADRLFCKSSASMELEGHVVAEMRAVQGVAFTTKMESMLADCALAEEMCDKFARWRALQERPDAEAPPQPVSSSSSSSALTLTASAVTTTEVCYASI